MFMNEVQFTAYQLGWQAVNPKKELKGLLVNIIVKSKRPEFRTLVVPYPSAKREAVLINFLFQAQQRRNAFLHKANITQCFNFEPCPFLRTCNRAV